MDKKSLENEIDALGLKVQYFNVDRLSLQLEQLNQKIKLIEDLPSIKKYEPVFLLRQSCGYHVKQ